MTLEKNLTELFNRGGRLEFGIRDGERTVTVHRPDLRTKIVRSLAKQDGELDAADVASEAEDTCRMAYGAGWPGMQRRNREGRGSAQIVETPPTGGAEGGDSQQ